MPIIPFGDVSQAIPGDSSGLGPKLAMPHFEMNEKVGRKS